MRTAIKISALLELRHECSDQMLIDYLSLAALLKYAPGIAATADLMTLWRVAQCNVSRRMNALDAAGLIDAYPGHGIYHIHELKWL